MAISMKTHAFIVGMSRGGTTWLSYCLGRHSELAVFGETRLWGRDYPEPDESGQYTPVVVGEMLDRMKPRDVKIYDERFSKTDFNSLLDDVKAELLSTGQGAMTPASVFDSLCRHVGELSGKERVVEKTPHHVNHIDRIMRYYPDAKFIAMYREPYSFMLSYKHQGDRQSDRVKKVFQNFYHPLGCAIVWRRYMKGMLDLMHRDLANVHIVEFSSIKKNPVGVLQAVQEFLGLRRLEDIADPPRNTSFPDAERPELKPDDIFWMNLVCGGVMKRVGVEPRAPGRNSFIPIVRSMMMVPFWGIRTFNHMRKTSGGGIVHYLKSWI